MRPTLLSTLVLRLVHRSRSGRVTPPHRSDLRRGEIGFTSSGILIALGILVAIASVSWYGSRRMTAADPTPDGAADAAAIFRLHDVRDGPASGKTITVTREGEILLSD